MQLFLKLFCKHYFVPYCGEMWEIRSYEGGGSLKTGGF